MKLSIQISLLVFVLLSGNVTAQQGEWATVKLQVLYDGPPPKLKPHDGSKEPYCAELTIPDERIIVGPKGELANVAMTMDMRKSESAAIHPELVDAPDNPLVIRAKNCLYSPRVAFLQTGRVLRVEYADLCGHNFKITTFSNSAFGVLLPIDAKVEMKFQEAERSNFTEFSCTIHPWMKGQLIIRDHPYVGISDAKGRLEIKDLPVGKVTFKFAHENMKKSINSGELDGKESEFPRGYITLDLKPGLNDLGILKLSPELFED